MHDFICSECTSYPLASTDLRCTPHESRIGETFALFHISDVLSSNISLQCKTEASLFDTVYGYGAHVSADCVCISKGWVDINTCVVRCGRCGSRIGDGEINSEDSKNDQTGFTSQDLDVVRCNLHTIMIKELSRPILQIEQVRSTRCRKGTHIFFRLLADIAYIFIRPTPSLDSKS